MKVLRVYHGGREPSHRIRDRGLVSHGADLTLVVPERWDEGGGPTGTITEDFRVLVLPVSRPGDVNRHRYRDERDLVRVLDEVRPDVLDIHEEPFSVVLRQWLSALAASSRPRLPVACYTAQNLDKRFPPPFAQYEKSAFRRVAGMYPCSRQAASVVRGKGFPGVLEVLPLGIDRARYRTGIQAFDAERLELGFVGRLVPEKGLTHAVRALQAVLQHRDARLRVIGRGPDLENGLALARRLGVVDRLEVVPWTAADQLADLYREMHVVLVPSMSTETWVEQFGRVVVEAQATGAVVVGYGSGSIPEVGGPAALLVPEGDEQALADGTARVASDEAEWSARRAAGVDQTSTLDWSDVTARQLRFYEVIAGEPVRRTTGRRAATTEFGEPARLPGFARPFALPVLRRDRSVTRLAARVLDAADRG